VVPRSLAAAGVSGNWISDEGTFSLLTLPSSVESALPILEMLWGARAGGESELVSELHWAPFLANDATRRLVLNPVPFLERYARSKGASLTIPLRPLDIAPPRRPLHELRPRERLVIAELFGHPERSVEEGARSVGLSSSTFAHTKSRLMRQGIFGPAVRIDPSRLGFPWIVHLAYRHRPFALRENLALVNTICSPDTAALGYFLSPTFSQATIPVRDGVHAHEVADRFRGRGPALRLLGEPFFGILNLNRMLRLNYVAPGDPVGAALAPLSKRPSVGRRVAERS
jgi:hypothetical protein